MKSTHSNNTRFYSLMSLATALVVFLGFGHVYGPRLTGAAESATTIIHLHAFIFSVWIIIFIAQCWFIIRGRISLHLKIGRFGLFWSVIMLISAVVTAIDAARLGHLGIPGVEFKTPAGFLMLNLNSAAIFFLLAWAGWFFRHNAATHKRLMLMATLAGLAPPGISRLPFIAGHTQAIAAVVMIFVLAGPLYDLKTTHRMHKAYLYTLPLVLFILPPVVALLSETNFWKNFTNVLIGL